MVPWSFFLSRWTASTTPWSVWAGCLPAAGAAGAFAAAASATAAAARVCHRRMVVTSWGWLGRQLALFFFFFPFCMIVTVSAESPVFVVTRTRWSLARSLKAASLVVFEPFLPLTVVSL